MEAHLPDTFSKEEKEEIERRHRLLIDAWQTRKEAQDLAEVDEAFYFAVEAHKDQRRRSGEPYIYHPIEVATIAAHDIGLGRTSIICALLHDVVEDTKYTLDDISGLFGEKVAKVVDGLTKFDAMDDAESIQAENFKKIISSLSYDTRVVLIKLSDRLHNMRTLDSMPKHKQLKIASETAYLYAPLAYRLGLHSIKIELEDLALKYTNPTIYENIRKRKDEVREQRLHELHDFAAPVMEALEKAGVKARTVIKERSVNSVWKRMMDKELAFEDLYGSFIVRFVTDSPKEQERIDCWKIYALLTNCYRPYTKKLKDWISFPKANGYESLHAVVMGQTGNWVEVQIRSERMDEIAEKGFAAYYKYKTDNQTESGFDEWLKKAQNLISNDSNNAIEFVDSFKLDLFSDEISVFTPRGQMIPLPKGATVLDFAYSIHSEIGDHSIAANVNSHLAQLDQVLRTGDRVEVITSEAQHPQEKWFEFLATATAKSRLKNGIKEYRRTFREEGEKRYEEIMRKIGLEASKANRNQVMAVEKLTSAVDFYYQVATGKIDERIIRDVLKPQSGSANFVRYLTFGLLGNKEKDETPSITSSGDIGRVRLQRVVVLQSHSGRRCHRVQLPGRAAANPPQRLPQGHPTLGPPRQQHRESQMAAQERNRIPRRAENHRIRHRRTAQPHDQCSFKRDAPQPARPPHGSQKRPRGSHAVALCTQYQGVGRPNRKTFTPQRRAKSHPKNQQRRKITHRI